MVYAEKIISRKKFQSFYKYTRYYLFAMVFMLLFADTSDAQGLSETISFQRPMTLVTQEQIDIVLQRIADEVEPQITGYQKLIQEADEYLSFTPDIPSSIYIDEEEGVSPTRTFVWNQTKPALANALAYTYSGNTDYADKAVEILNAWGNESPTINADFGGHLDIVIGQGFTRFVHAADLLWDYSGWSQEDRDNFVDWLYYLDSRITGRQWSSNNIADVANLFKISLACLTRDESLLREVEEWVENWLDNYDARYNSSSDKISYSSEHDVVYLKRETDRGGNGLSYSFVSGSAMSLIMRVLLILGWDIMEIPVPPDSATMKGALRNTAQWYMDYVADVHTYPFYDPPEAIKSPATLELFEHLNNYLGGEDIELQNWLDENRFSHQPRAATNSMGFYYDPYVTLNQGDMLLFDSEDNVPATPSLISPVENATEVSINPTLSWESVGAADTYTLQVSENSDMSSPVENVSGITGTSREVSLEYETTYYWRVRAVNEGGPGIWSSVRNFTTDTLLKKTEQKIYLQEGWNTISGYIEPHEKDITGLFEDIQDNLYMIRNNYGEVYWPEYNINDIDIWDSNEGYQVNMKNPDTLIIYGEQLNPEATPISLSRGWNIKPYIVDQPMPVETALESIAPDIELVTNNSGEIYWPEYNVNDIGEMQPGEGYKIFLINAATLTYPLPSSSAMKIAGSSGQQPASTPRNKSRFYNTNQLNTGSNAILLIQSGHLEDGDEVAVWSEDDMLIGNGSVSNNRSAVTIWGRDTMNENAEFGAWDNELLRLTVWLQSEDKERPLTIKSLSCLMNGELDNLSIRYEKNSILVAEVFPPNETPKNYLLRQNYPNPFNPSTTIEYAIPNDERVILEIYNILGQKITTLVDKEQRAGTYRIEFEAKNLSSGVYIYRLNAGNYTDIKRMILVQ